MRNLLTILFALFSVITWSQATNGTVVNTSNSAEPVVQEESVEELEQDSLVIKTESLDSKYRGIKKGKIKEKKFESRSASDISPAPAVFEVADEAPAAPGSASSEMYEQTSYGFTYSKQQSSVQRSQRSPSADQQLQMDQAVGFFESNSPNSFEFHYFKYVSGNYDVSLVNHLEEAEKLRPNNADVQVQLAAYNMIKRNKDSALVMLEKLKTAGRLSDNVLHYSEDILLSVPKNGVLITHGFDDSYGAWYKQQESGVRSDVSIISLDFLQSAHYRALLKEDGFVMPESETINIAYLKQFCQLNSAKALSISLTTPKEYFKDIQSKLFITGLVFEYHEEVFNNFHRNDELWNEILKKHLVDNATDEKAKQLSSNYLPMLLQLRKVYAQTEEEVKLKDVDEASDKVGVQCKKYDQVQKLKGSY